VIENQSLYLTTTIRELPLYETDTRSYKLRRILEENAFFEISSLDEAELAQKALAIKEFSQDIEARRRLAKYTVIGVAVWPLCPA